MSAGAVFRQVLALLSRLDLPAVARSDLLSALEAARPGPMVLLYEAGAEAGLESDVLRNRVAAIFLGFAAGNLADDLSDGDCDYLASPRRLGPCAQFSLQSLALAALNEPACALPPDALVRFGRELARSAGLQHVELRTTEWTEAIYRDVAEGIAGRQYAAYLAVLWDGTHLATRAEICGRLAGIAGHIAADVCGGDARFASLAPVEQRAVRDWALASLGELRAHRLRCMDAVARQVEAALAGRSLGEGG